MASTKDVERAGVMKDDATGDLFLPETRRADGSIRKARRVKAGYVPPEEVPVYENENVKYMKTRAGVPVGLSPDLVTKARAAKESATRGHVMTNKEARKAKVETTGSNKQAGNNRKGKKKVEDDKDAVGDLLASVYGINVSGDQVKKDEQQSVQDADPAKKLKNLQKKLKQTEKLEEKIKGGEIKQPSQEELDKVSRKSAIEAEIKSLQKKLESS